MNLEEKYKALEQEILHCQKCPLWRTRINPVPGQGSLKAKIMFIGEAPGANEDKEGKPFCGAAGKVLDHLLEIVDLDRKDIFITNILKCRPPQNRDPQKKEIEACAPYLERQIEIIKPKIICTLGNYSTSYIFEKYGLKNKIQGISKIHGQVFEVKNLFQNIKIIPLYHPAVVTYNIGMRKILEEDFKVLKNFISKI
ncbi:uracil-DNA glycosylase [bacterium]|nr:uracil-DNA glycosylase [bacterium]